MTNKTGISWTQYTLNVICTGCTPISPACKNCWAKGTSEKLHKNPNPKIAYRYRNKFEPTIHYDLFEYDLEKIRKARGLVFMGSMTDLFQDGVPASMLETMFKYCSENRKAFFLFLTKRPINMVKVVLGPAKRYISPNMGFGATIETAKYLSRLYPLSLIKRSFPDQMTFISAEPLLGYIDDHDFKDELKNLDWVITGGESGPVDKIRPLDLNYVRSVRTMCQSLGIAFHHKQHGGNTFCKPPHGSGIPHKRTKGCRLLDGRLWNQYPPQIKKVLDKWE